MNFNKSFIGGQTVIGCSFSNVTLGCWSNKLKLWEIGMPFSDQFSLQIILLEPQLFRKCLEKLEFKEHHKGRCDAMLQLS